MSTTNHLTEAGETLTPDSQKSTLDKAKEGITDTADSVAASVQPGTLSIEFTAMDPY